MNVTIHTNTELHELARRKSRDGISRVTLALPGAARDLRRSEDVINRGLHACGCKSAAIFLVAAIAVLAVHVLLSPSPVLWTSASTLWHVSLVLLGSALAGKILGLAWAEWRLQKAIKRIASNGRKLES